MASTYRLYGLSVESTLPLTYNVPRTAAAPDLRIVETPSPLPAAFWADTTLLSREAGEGIAIPSTLARHQDGVRHALRFDGAAEFLLASDAIVYHLADPGLAYAVEVWLMGTVLSLWNELRGVPTLHTAAVAVDGKAVGFLATNKGGKSSLAAALLQAGHSLLTDDILMVEVAGSTVMAQPSYPQMRMWPDQAQHFLGTEAGLPLVVPHLTKRRVAVGVGGFGRFQPEAVPISHLFLPERRSDVDGVQIDRISPQEALVELLRHSFLPNTVAHLGLSAQRLPILAALVQQASVSRLVYPDGTAHLPRVAEAIVRHVRSSTPSAPPTGATGAPKATLARTARR